MILEVMGAVIVASAWLALQLSLHAEPLRPRVTGGGAAGSFLKTTAVEPEYFLAVWIGHAVSAVAPALWLLRRRIARPGGQALDE